MDTTTNFDFETTTNPYLTGSPLEGVCPKCGKPYLYVGDVIEDAPPPFCTCLEKLDKPETKLLYTQSPNLGWVCPKCGNVYAPGVDECRECNGIKLTITTSCGFPGFSSQNE